MAWSLKRTQWRCTCEAAKFQPGLLLTHSNTLLSLMALSQGLVPIRLTSCEKSCTNMTWTMSDWQPFREKNVDMQRSPWKVCQAMQLSKTDGSVQCQIHHTYPSSMDIYHKKVEGIHHCLWTEETLIIWFLWGSRTQTNTLRIGALNLTHTYICSK